MDCSVSCENYTETISFGQFGMAKISQRRFRHARSSRLLGGRIVGSDLRSKGARPFPGRGLARDVKASPAEKKRPRTAKAPKADVVAHLSARKNEPESSGGYFTRRKCVMPLTDTDMNPGQHNKPKFAS